MPYDLLSNLTPGKIQADIDDIDLILIIELRTLLYIIIYLSHVWLSVLCIFKQYFKFLKPTMTFYCKYAVYFNDPQPI